LIDLRSTKVLQKQNQGSYAKLTHSKYLRCESSADREIEKKAD
jgi:hypothetical protein